MLNLMKIKTKIAYFQFHNSTLIIEINKQNKL